VGAAGDLGLVPGLGLSLNALACGRLSSLREKAFGVIMIAVC
jgi:hypothetical protein